MKKIKHKNRVSYKALKKTIVIRFKNYYSIFTIKSVLPLISIFQILTKLYGKYFHTLTKVSTSRYYFKSTFGNHCANFMI